MVAFLRFRLTNLDERIVERGGSVDGVATVIIYS